MRIEEQIINNLVFNEDYCRKVIYHIDPDYFELPEERIVVDITKNFFNEYSKLINPDILKVELNSREEVNAEIYQKTLSYIDKITPSEVPFDWLYTESEKFCKNRKLYNTIITTYKVISGEDKEVTPNAFPSLFQEALAVTFDKHIGHDYDGDSDERYDFFTKKRTKHAFGIREFDKITAGGFENKQLICVMAGTGVGKSMFMCHMTAHYIRKGYKVLYVTNEMSEEKIAQRIDANLLDKSMAEVYTMKKDIFTSQVKQMSEKGQLIIKEYPNVSAGNVSNLMEELRIKKDFVPGILFVDYINKCSSDRNSRGVAKHEVIKNIANEFRNLAMKCDIPVFTATQANREGNVSSNPSLAEVSDSMGLPNESDFMFSLSTTQELNELNQIQVKQLKNRDNDVNYINRFVIGVEKPKSKFFELEESAQPMNYDSAPKKAKTPPPQQPYQPPQTPSTPVPPTTGYNTSKFGTPIDLKW